MMHKVAILTRVSRVDQSNDRQINDLKEFAADRGYNVVRVVSEKISGATETSKRVGLQEVLELARAKKINKVLIHEVTRLGRNTGQMLVVIEELHKLGVSVVVKDYNLETLNPDGSVNSMAQLLITFLLDLGRMERATLIERTKSGLEEARRKGKVLGRPKGKQEAKELLKKHSKVVKYLKEGSSIMETVKLCDVSKSTVQRVKKLIAK